MSQVTVVGEDSEACSKVTCPVTLESPRRTATVGMAQVSGFALAIWVTDADKTEEAVLYLPLFGVDGT